LFYFDIIVGGFKIVFQPPVPADDLRKKALLNRYGSNFKYTEFQEMSSTISVVVFTVAMVFGFGMLLISPVSHDDAEVFLFFY